VPDLIALAGELPDRWLALTALAAGTHLPPGPGLTAIHDAIRATLHNLRAAADAGYRARPDSPWLARGFSPTRRCLLSDAPPPPLPDPATQNISIINLEQCVHRAI
jgi:hypothetical protein